MKNLANERTEASRLSFRQNENGSMSAMIGLSMLAICVAIGAAIDFGRVTAAQQRLAVSMDAAVLHVANLSNKTEAQLREIAHSNLMKNYGSDTYDEVSGFTLKAPPGKIQASANVRVRTWFMSIVGYKYMDIPIRAEVVRGGKNIEVALVLDNTYSMTASAGNGKNRITVLREAAADFVDTVISDPAGQAPYYSRAALVPFAGTVNPGSLLGGVRLAVKTPANCTSWGCQTFNAGSGYVYSLTGCVTERMGADATTDASITASRAGYAYNRNGGGNYDIGDSGCINGQVKLLTDDKAALKANISGMTANGGTAGHVGLQWGFQVLSPNSGLSGISGDAKAQPGPFNDEKYKKIMLFMTDGEMTQWSCNGIMRYVGYGVFPGGCENPNGDSQKQAVATCANIKARNIELYFIGIGLDASNSNVSELTKACSTDASHIILATDGAALKAAFQKIADSIKELRLSM